MSGFPDMGLPSTILPIMGKRQLDADTILWLAQLTTSFGTNPSASAITAMNTLIVGLKADGNWTLLDRLWIFAQSVQGYARVSIKNPSSTQITEVNTPTWTANQGYTGNGTNMYLNTNYNFSTSSVNASQNSLSYGVYVTTNVAEAKYDCGAFTTTGGTKDIVLSSRWSDNRTYIGTNSSTGEANASNLDSRGMFSGKRIASNAQTALKNGSQIASLSDSTNALPSLNLFVLCMNNSATPSSFTTRRVAMCFVGGGGINHATFYTRFQTFATSIGFNV